MTASLPVLEYSENDTLTTAKNATCNCSYCNANLLESPSAFQTLFFLHDLAVLAGGGGTVTPASIGINNARQLIHGYEWGEGGGTAANVTYSFPGVVPSYYASNAQERVDFEGFSAPLISATRDILGQISNFANITFTQVSGNGDIVFGQAYLTTPGSNPDAYTYYPDQGAYGGDVWLNNRYDFDSIVDRGEVGNYILMHEIGHSLGLIHSFTAGLTDAENSEQFTVMSYDISNWGYDINVSSYMLYDIAAIQAIYGANTSYNAGNTSYTLDPNAAYTIWDGGGTDTLDSSAFSSDVILHLEEGGFSSVGEINNIAIAYGAVIENARSGNGNDFLYGNNADNKLDGGAGADFINGGNGRDMVDYSSSALAVKVDLLNGSANGGNAQGDTLISIESVVGSNNAAERDYLWGDNANNSLYGKAGKDILEGSAGADTIDGGDGWDNARYVRSSAGVTINLQTNVNTGGDAQGDKLYNIEAVTGSLYDDTLSGGAGNDTFYAGNGNDTLFGGGGFDQLFGENGNDTYIFKDGRSHITETGSGIDAVSFNSVWTPSDLIISGNDITFKSSTDLLSFNDISLIEWFSFTGLSPMSLSGLITASTASTASTQPDQTFIGTSAIESFNGSGLSDTADYSSSPLAVKIDLLNGSVSGGHATSDTLHAIENIIGSNNVAERDYIWGDNGANALYGMAGKDVLEGGAGADVLEGGDGWDYARYIRSNEGVHINLETNTNIGGDAQGDKLYNIEAIVGSNHNDTLSGSAGNDYLKGENGSDVLYGGNGVDELYGGNGADTFVFKDFAAFTHLDQIKDFSIAQGDALDISDLLSGYDALTDIITDFVQIANSGTSSILSVDVDGGANNFLQVALLYDITGLTDEQSLLVSGNLIA